MKARKALKRLHRVETLLGTVIDQYDGSTPEVNELLSAARSSVASATQTLAAPPARKPAGKAEQPQSRKTIQRRPKASLDSRQEALGGCQAQWYDNPCKSPLAENCLKYVSERHYSVIGIGARLALKPMWYPTITDTEQTMPPGNAGAEQFDEQIPAYRRTGEKRYGRLAGH